MSIFDKYNFSDLSEHYDETITRKIHQTRKTKKVPKHLRDQVNSWKEKNSNYEYKLWDDSECLRFIELEYPEFLSTYNWLPRPVMKADLFRYLVIYHYGGVYSDIDTWCEKSIDEWVFDPQSLLISIEANVNDRQRKHSRYTHNLQYCQWTFYAPKGHPTLYKIATRIKEKIENGFKIITDIDVLKCTGPGIFTEIINEDIETENIQILPQETFAWNESCNGSKEDFKETILVLHTGEGSWKNSSLDSYGVVVIFYLIISLILVILIFYFSIIH